MVNNRVIARAVLLLAMTIPARLSGQTPPFELKEIGPNVWAAVGGSNPATSANAGFVIGDTGVAVFDSFVSEEGAVQLLAEIRKRTPLPVKFVINSHYHADHVAGNRVFAQSGAVVVAQRHVREWIVPENLRMMGKEIKPELKAFIEGIALPALLYDGEVDLYLGSRRLRVRSFPGHTGGDSVLLVADANAMFCGDLFWRDALPNLVDATTTAWIRTLDTLMAEHPTAAFVPGHGAVGNVQDVRAFREYLATLRALVSAAQNSGKTDDALPDAVMPALAEKYGMWDWFQYLAKPNIQHMQEELSGAKRVPQPSRK
jgi:cyclase